MTDPWFLPHATGDFETYSEAGFIWNEVTGKWENPKGARKKGLSEIGAAVYAEHPSTDALCFVYKLPAWWTGRGDERHRWLPGMPPPQALLDFLAAGGLLECHNVMFERLIWFHVMRRRYGWPSLEPYANQLRCSMAKARVNSLPGALGALTGVLNTPIVKDKGGKRLLDKFSVPRNPTKADPRTRILPQDDPADAELLYGYCETDVESEHCASDQMHPLAADELYFWLIDQEINWRGVGIDRAGVRDCMAVLDQALALYGEECRQITGFNPTQLAELKGWLSARGLYMNSMDADAIEETLARLPPPPPGIQDPRRRVLEIRQLIGSASVKKLYAMDRQTSQDDRIRNLIVHHGARTGRPTGDLTQPLNLPKAGPDLFWCGSCAKPFRVTLDGCPWCGVKAVGLKKRKWSAEACDHVLDVMKSRSLELVEWFFGDALLAIAGCVRGLFVAGPGNELIASDFSAIEAVVTAMLAGEEWRIQTFRDRKDIYLQSAAKITGRTAEEYAAYFNDHGENHPDRQKIGKVAELGLGFGGWITAWRQFDDSDTFTDEQVKELILAWRAASPRVVEMWGGQTRGLPWEPDCRQEYYGFEGCAVQAIMYPGTVFEYAGIKFYMRGDALIIRILSGRELTYHCPRLTPSTRKWSKPWEMQITYMTWNTNPKYGPTGWVPMSTYSSKLTENIVQAIAHDILRFAIVNLRALGYACVLHVYDEIVLEVPIGTGSIEEVERVMGTMPWWAIGWPVRASGGWRGRRYRKG